VLPVSLKINNSRASIPSIVIANSGSQRFDLYGGSFTKNDQLTISPFTDAFNYIPNVPYGVAKQLTPYMNNAGSNNKRYVDAEERDTELYSMGYVGKRYRKWLEDMHRYAQETKRAESVNGTLGYVTQDVSLHTIPSAPYMCSQSLILRIVQAWATTSHINLCLSTLSLHL
jgi:hypothetical protein